MQAVDALGLRQAVPADAAAVAELWLRSYADALPRVRRVHTDEQVHAWIGDVVLPHRETWVAVLGGSVAGMMVCHDGELEQLYVDPCQQGHGIGSRLVRLAKQRNPSGLHLWTFQVNGRALRLYLQHGFVEVARTNGHRNEEREPDVRLCWRPEPGRG